ncbi:universal stress protein [Tautonia rosea]|uniref:universal stress protein n=1 Tax=Tautonia rosea TaxID=2728037 RepID=UPI001474D8C8|nr:universal stress protein [Tautonia rosea]
MKILVPIDGSPCSRATIEELCRHTWPANSEIKVITVIHVGGPEVFDPMMMASSFHFDLLAEARKHAPKLVEGAAQTIMERTKDVKVTYEVLEGVPKEEIVGQAEYWGADLIVLGSHGHGPVGRFFLGSVSHAVAMHAPCSVQIVRKRAETKVG